MRQSFSQWLRQSNDAGDLRIALEKLDQMPTSLSVQARVAMHDALMINVEMRWHDVKQMMLENEQ